MSRTADSKLQKDITLATDPIEAVKKYADKYTSSHIKADGRARIELLKQAASFTDPTGTTKGQTHREMRSEYSDIIKNLEEHWTKKWNGGAVPENIVAQGLAAAADVFSGAVLGRNPNMWLFNSAQFIANGQHRDFSHNMRAIIKTPSLAKSVFRETANIPFLEGITNGTHVTRGAQKLVEGIKDPLYKKVVSDYFRHENPDIMMESLVPMSGIVQKVFTAMTPFFMGTDITSRTHALFATTSYIDSIYTKIGAKNIANGIGKDRLFKEAHLARFGKFSRDEIMSASGNKEEFISRYARYATRQEIYNYHKIFRPEILDTMGQNWATARAARFLSWPMHYYSYLRSIAKSAEAGDTKPLKNLAVQAVVWYGLMNSVGGADIPVLSDVANYGVSRGPVIGTAKGVASTLIQHGGMLSSPISILLTPAFKVDEYTSQLLRGGQKNFDWTTNQVYNSAKNNPAWGSVKWLSDFAEEK